MEIVIFLRDIYEHNDFVWRLWTGFIGFLRMVQLLKKIIVYCTIV